ncbi:MAG: magnesium transporter MgtE N-terminal domain-containing protein [Lachnospiraceae bacterium]|jgi:hypothetical protein
MRKQHIRQILSWMESDEAVDFLKNTDSGRKASWLSHMDAQKRELLEKLAAYSEDTIGSRMTANFIRVRLSMRQGRRWSASLCLPILLQSCLDHAGPFFRHVKYFPEFSRACKLFSGAFPGI